jgi:hypothetical protein
MLPPLEMRSNPRVCVRAFSSADCAACAGRALHRGELLLCCSYLNPQGTYVGVCSPTFLVRGLAIPVVSSCARLAVINAVPTKQAGQASGTLGMARNIGAAFGVAVLSQVYLFSRNTPLPSSLATNGDDGAKGAWQKRCRKKSNACPSHRMDNCDENAYVFMLSG